MTVNGIGGANGNMQAGRSGMKLQKDSVSKNIQNQIANAQKKLQELSSNENMTIEDKMKKRQEIQQQITDLNQQLRQRQIEQRKEMQQNKSGRHAWRQRQGIKGRKPGWRTVTGQYAGHDFSGFLHEAGKGAGRYGNQNGRPGQSTGVRDKVG